MSFLGLLVRNLFYHWRGNLAVFLGIVLGSAVLTGALLVGDSLRGSLKALTLDQLGWVEQAMLPNRFFRATLASEVSAERHAPGLILQGSATRSDDTGRVGRVSVLGIDASFWPTDQVPEGSEFWASTDAEVVLNRTLADALGVKVGEQVKLNVQRADQAPAESLLGQRQAERVIAPLLVKVRLILPDEGMARFSLSPTPTPVRNAFVPIRFLQRRLDLAGRANAVFIAKAKLTLDDWGLRYRSPKDRAESFFRMLRGDGEETQQLKPARWQGRLPEALAKQVKQDGGGLTVKHLIDYYAKNRDYNVLDSRRLMLEPNVEQAIDRLVMAWGEVPRWQVKRILIYLADTIGGSKLEGPEVPYSIIAGVDATIEGPLASDEILVTKWPGSPLKVKPGSKLTMSYFVPDQKNNLAKKAAAFKVRAVVPIEGELDDPDLVPEVPGVTDKLDITSWENPPFPYDPKRNTKADVDFSKRYRTTPRAYVNLKKAQELWGNRFGDLTSIQVRPGREAPDTLPKNLLAELDADKGGFVFQPVREQAVQASSGTSDFGWLFLGFSFFLIISALLLVGLLVRLNLDRRAGEIGLLLAIGWDHGRVRRLLLAEGALLAIVGSAVGLGGALLYGWLMLRLLAANWPGGASLNFLTLHATPTSFGVGFGLSLIVSVATLWWATRVLGKLSPRALLSGETAQAATDARFGWSRWLIPGGTVGALLLALLARFLPSQEAQAGCFFGSGALLLIACLAGVRNGFKWLNRASSPQPSLLRLGIRNASRNAVRSVLTVGLLAAAAFLIVAVESFHKESDQHFAMKTGGSGGFAFYAEGNVPVFEELTDADVRRRVGLDTPEMRTAKFFPCRVQAGDDASCLNLYKPLKPRVMGVTQDLIARGGFHFAATKPLNAVLFESPWHLLDLEDDGAIPAIIDANTAQWILKVGLGDTVEVPNDKGELVKFRIVALLEESIFQSEILVSEANFLKLYPQQSGSTFLLIDPGAATPEEMKALKAQLVERMGKEYNMDVQTTGSRLQDYLAVENMYLLTFQALGGLGLILGAAGLAIVLLRGVWERRAELALLQALGFRSGQLALLVLAENAFLLVLGLAAGTASALLAVAPHLVGSGAQVLWLRIAGLLAAVLIVGLMAAALAVWSTLRTPVLTALRRE